MKHFALLLLLAAAAPAGLRPGLWEMTGTPGQASLNGRPLGDLPYTPPTAPDRQCRAAADLDPATLIAAQVPPGCTVARRTAGAGRLTLTGTCQPQDAGQPRGTFRLTGRWSRDTWSVAFATENPSENGRMGFSGTVAARRIGDCPA